MIGVLLTILKILGIILLVILGIILFLLVIVLFVPIRYDIRVSRKTEDTSFVRLKVRVFWLLHMVNGVFSYPQEAFFRVRFLWFTIFRSDGGGKSAAPEKKKEKKKVKEVQEEEAVKEELVKEEPVKEATQTREAREEQPPESVNGSNGRFSDGKISEEKVPNEEEAATFKSRLLEFFGKIWNFLKNIQYTITRICDKIKHIVKNIQYYLKILQSDAFRNAWHVCGDETVSLLKSILPRKLEGQLRVGTGDPAGTGQILSVYGILYPLIGNHIDILPDFEQAVLEGELFAKGRITVFRVLKTAWVIYFNKDLRRLIKLLKKGGS